MEKKTYQQYGRYQWVCGSSQIEIDRFCQQSSLVEHSWVFILAEASLEAADIELSRSFSDDVTSVGSLTILRLSAFQSGNEH